MTLQQQFREQQFANGYDLVDGVAMHAENGARFQIPHDVLKRHVQAGYFVELRIDSPRFSVHEESAEKYYCASCSGEASKPILSHNQPAFLVPIARQNVPSRGWGEDFWVQVTGREGPFFKAVIDNPLYESRLHELNLGDAVYFHEDHILAVHSSHRQEMVLGMDAGEIKTLANGSGRSGREEMSKHPWGTGRPGGCRGRGLRVRSPKHAERVF